MKRIIFITVALMLVVGGISFAGITGSKHDLSSTTGAANTTRFNIDDLCVFCHTPHFGNMASGVAPLWNRQDSVTAWGNNNGYTSVSLNGGSTGPGAANAMSAVCLSCHDGNIGDEVLINGPGSGNLNLDVSANAVGNPFNTVGNLNDGINGLLNDHPIGVNAAAGDTEIYSVAAITGAGLPLYDNFGNAGNYVECSTCHSVHNSTAFQPMLRVTNSASAMCLDCHNK